MYPKYLQNMIDQLRKLPGVGAKTAERYAFTLLQYSTEDIMAFSEAFVLAKKNIHPCHICGNLSDQDKCEICKDTHRDKTTICVVQDSKDVIALERMQEYQGVYHVLNGLVSTQKGIMPEDINIPALIERVDESVVEVILATNPTIEGETTALYIAKRLMGKPCSVTRLARGIPMGGHVDYIDEMTLIKAMQGRKKM
ncbi:MAG: recombination mediator RecR [Erysipelotrichaceae bacterium]